MASKRKFDRRVSESFSTNNFRLGSVQRDYERIRDIVNDEIEDKTKVEVEKAIASPTGTFVLTMKPITRSLNRIDKRTASIKEDTTYIRKQLTELEKKNKESGSLISALLGLVGTLGGLGAVGLGALGGRGVLRQPRAPGKPTRAPARPRAHVPFREPANPRPAPRPTPTRPPVGGPSTRTRFNPRAVPQVRPVAPNSNVPSATRPMAPSREPVNPRPANRPRWTFGPYRDPVNPRGTPRARPRFPMGPYRDPVNPRGTPRPVRPRFPMGTPREPANPAGTPRARPRWTFGPFREPANPRGTPRARPRFPMGTPREPVNPRPIGGGKGPTGVGAGGRGGGIPKVPSLWQKLGIRGIMGLGLRAVPVVGQIAMGVDTAMYIADLVEKDAQFSELTVIEQMLVLELAAQDKIRQAEEWEASGEYLQWAKIYRNQAAAHLKRKEYIQQRNQYGPTGKTLSEYQRIEENRRNLAPFGTGHSPFGAPTPPISGGVGIGGVYDSLPSIRTRAEDEEKSAMLPNLTGDYHNPENLSEYQRAINSKFRYIGLVKDLDSVYDMAFVILESRVDNNPLVVKVLIASGPYRGEHAILRRITIHNVQPMELNQINQLLGKLKEPTVEISRNNRVVPGASSGGSHIQLTSSQFGGLQGMVMNASYSSDSAGDVYPSHSFTPMTQSGRGTGGSSMGVSIGGAGGRARGSVPAVNVGRIPKDRKSMMAQVYDSFINAGFSDAQARALTAEVGRENSYNPSLIFGSHTDPHNRSKNSGFFSWQGSRGNELMRHLASKGLVDSNGKIVQSQEALNAMAEFSRKEMLTNPAYKATREGFLNNPNIDSETAARVLGKNYIRWRIDDPRYAHHANHRRQFYGEVSSIVEERSKTIPPKMTADGKPQTNAGGIGGAGDPRQFPTSEVVGPEHPIWDMVDPDLANHKSGILGHTGSGSGTNNITVGALLASDAVFRQARNEGVKMKVATGGGSNRHSANHGKGGVGESIDIKPVDGWRPGQAERYAKIANAAGANRLGVPHYGSPIGLHVQNSTATGRPTMSWNYGGPTDMNFRNKLLSGTLSGAEERQIVESLYESVKTKTAKFDINDIKPAAPVQQAMDSTKEQLDTLVEQVDKLAQRVEDTQKATGSEGQSIAAENPSVLPIQKSPSQERANQSRLGVQEPIWL